jgi:carboxylesterase type B
MDGAFITGTQLEACVAGRFIKVPLMVGNAAHEGNTMAPNASSADEVLQMLRAPHVGLSDVRRQGVVEVYGPLQRGVIKHAPWFAVVSEVMAEAYFVCPGNAVTIGGSAFRSWREGLELPLESIDDSQKHRCNMWKSQVVR